MHKIGPIEHNTWLNTRRHISLLTLPRGFPRKGHNHIESFYSVADADACSQRHHLWEEMSMGSHILLFCHSYCSPTRADDGKKKTVCLFPSLHSVLGIRPFAWVLFSYFNPLRCGTRHIPHRGLGNADENNLEQSFKAFSLIESSQKLISDSNRGGKTTLLAATLAVIWATLKRWNVDLMVALEKKLAA